MPLALRRAVFLDRDGVLNRPIVRDRRPFPPASPEQLKVVPLAVEACDALRAAGFFLVVVTNQPDVARGKMTIAAVDLINARLRSKVVVDDLRVCFHDDEDQCLCRKPKPGMLLQAARDNGLNLSASYLVGDRWRDIEAGRNAGCRTILIDFGWNDRPCTPDVRTGSLVGAVEWILGRPLRAA
ncbi:MAG: HAD family hydrolase [Deltaproteobacteria bacterium]|nr:HAD family hydrolase [Deltaproteobacteria bacterium]